MMDTGNALIFMTSTKERCIVILLYMTPLGQVDRILYTVMIPLWNQILLSLPYTIVSACCYVVAFITLNQVPKRNFFGEEESLFQFNVWILQFKMCCPLSLSAVNHDHGWESQSHSGLCSKELRQNLTSNLTSHESHFKKYFQLTKDLPVNQSPTF